MGTLHDPLVAARYAADITRRIEAQGLAISEHTDFAALERQCADLEEKPGLSEPFSPRFFDIGPADGLWLCGRNSEGAVVHVQAMRRDTLDGLTLAEHWRQQLRRIHCDQSAPVRFDEQFCPATRDISGVVVEHGEMWIAPDARKRGLAGHLARLALALALLKWVPDYVYGYVSEELVLNGFPAREGYMHMQPRAVDWTHPAVRFSADDYLVWMARQDLEHLVRQPVQRILSDSRALPCQFAVDRVRRDGDGSHAVLAD